MLAASFEGSEYSCQFFDENARSTVPEMMGAGRAF